LLDDERRVHLPSAAHRHVQLLGGHLLDDEHDPPVDRRALRLVDGERVAEGDVLVGMETVARLLGVGERYVRRMVAERRIEFVKIGHSVRFDLGVVCERVEDRRRPPSERTPV